MLKKFDNFTSKLLNSSVSTALLFVMGFILCAGLFYNILDFEYATDKDYEPLYKIQQTVIEDFDTVYTFSNTDIDISDSNIIVSIYGDDFSLKSYFDKSMTYQKTEEIDNTIPIWKLITILIMCSIVGSLFFYLASTMTLVIIGFIIRNASTKYKHKDTLN